jgi:monoamine oxidase
VIILGAGIAGMTAAWELRKAGYDADHPGSPPAHGRPQLDRAPGDKIEQTDGSRQVCEFDEGQYMNAGPARLPSHHQMVLGYCRELGVELEVEVNTSRSALLMNPAANGGKPIQMRRRSTTPAATSPNCWPRPSIRARSTQDLTGRRQGARWWPS